MHRFEGECLQNEEVDAAAEGIGLLGVARCHMDSSLEVKRSMGKAFLEVKRRGLPHPRSAPD